MALRALQSVSTRFLESEAVLVHHLDPDVRWRGRIAVRAAFGIGPWGFVFAGVFLVLGFPIMAASLMVAGTAVLCAPVVLHRTGSRALTAHLLAFGLFQSLVGPAILLDGIWAACIPWLGFCVIAAALIDGRRSGLIWLGVCSAALLGLYAAWVFDILPEPVAPLGLRWPLATFTHLGFLTVLASIGIAASAAVDQQRHELEQARQDALDASRSKSMFLAQMSHELRTPMNAVLGYTEMLLEDADGQDAADLTRIHRAGTHLLGLVNDVLDLSKVEAGQLKLADEAVRITTVLRDVLDQTGPLLESKRNEARLDGPDAWVRGDARRLRQCVLNLVANANRFTRDGTLTLRVRLEGPEVHVEVQDTGVGMDAEQVARVFEPFVQVHAPSGDLGDVGGTGLGLAIVRELVRRMGGRIEVESTPGTGSTFRMVFPKVPPPHDGDPAR